MKAEKFEAEQEVRNLEKEVGPIKYVAQLLFGGDPTDLLDKAVQVFILMLVFVFDPTSSYASYCGNQTLLRYGINLESTGPEQLKKKLFQRYIDMIHPTSTTEVLSSAVDDAPDVMLNILNQK